MSPRTRLEIADWITVLALLGGFEYAAFHVHGWWQYALADVGYLMAIFASRHVYRLAKAGLAAREDDR